MRFKKILFFMAVVLFAALIVGGLFYEDLIKQYYPGFSSVLLFSGIIFFGGITYAIVERSLIIGAIAVILTILVPLINKWLVNYWDWLARHIDTMF